MKVTKVWLDESLDSCIVCGMCESIAPEVFEVSDKMHVIEGVDYSLHSDEIKEAVDSCPTNVIAIEEE
ncbi:ferredoxin [Parabacteroides sp. FAFU027]|uniref:ferredoxin n=1 Tax=Parabacteroides sp. FAFU027 TaxID=2922715 RepID=UPI001FAF9DC8|nr:ferredoxin [Parabacteroides sp. FAFU027]